MVVASRRFALSSLISQARIWKSLLSRKLDKFPLSFLISSSAETWKIFTNMLWQVFLRLSWHFKRENPLFWKASLLQNKHWLTLQACFFLRLGFAWLSRIPPTSLFISGYANTENVFYCLSTTFLEQYFGWLYQPSSAKMLFLILFIFVSCNVLYNA